MNIAQLLTITIERQASDLHLVVGYPPGVRVNGDLVAIAGYPELTAGDLNELLTSLLSPLQRSVFESTLELDFGFTFENKARFRANLYKQQGNVSASFRLIPFMIPALDTLGLPKVIEGLADLKQGLVLVTGPTGHGKSTTLASFINQINQKRPAHIITIEDPIEYIYPKAKSLISQRELNADTKSWANALKSALREDPDIVLVGELRDLETISATMTLAETGHLVFGTLHTNSAAQSIDRIVDVFPDNQQPQIKLQLASTLEAIISQRLIPTIVPGRVLAVELLLKNPAVSELIRSSKTHLIDNLIQTSAELGMTTLESSLLRLIKEGKISFETAQNYSLRPDLLTKLVNS